MKVRPRARRIILLLGPTAVGKTAIACALQSRLGGADHARLISVDSAMVYRGLDIGTAKPTPDELAQFPHDLIDIREPEEPFTAADFVDCADAAVERALGQDQIPVLVGGTMLYAKCFLEGIASLPAADPALRETLARELDERGAPAMHAELGRWDAQAAARIHPHNVQRLLRALEVIRATGRPISALWQSRQGRAATERLNLEVTTYVVDVRDRKQLHARIETRFHAMLEQGFEAELSRLAGRSGLDPRLPAWRAVGYRQGLRYLRGEISQVQFRDDTLTATRRLAKRQMTWLRSWPGARRLAWETLSVESAAARISSA